MPQLTVLPTAQTEPDTLTAHNYHRTLDAVYRAAVQTGLPVALWRQPRQQEKEAVVDFSGVARPTKIDFTRRWPGFAFAPFVNAQGKATLFINAGLHLNRAGHHFLTPLPKAQQPNKTRFLAAYHAQTLAPSERAPRWETAPSPLTGATAGQAEFCRLVDEAIAYIKATDIKKIVASRATEISLPAPFNPLTTFDALCRAYRRAFVSLVSIPGAGTWMGASPELLLSLTGAGLRTVALAGTQARPGDATPLPEVRWGDKEIEEQALVSDYIRRFFKDLGLQTFAEVGPRTVSAGNVVHLQTEFTVQRDALTLRRLANQILDNLHPTSAVCGMPKKEALSFILEKEKYNRAFYSGFLGPVHLNDQSHLFVNLRCMQLKRRSALLYVGAGITQDSVPQAEWQETVLKSNTLLSIVRPTPA
ncbi:MAG: chorismate-binding protein [Anaerolineae bacterium]